MDDPKLLNGSVLKSEIVKTFVPIQQDPPFTSGADQEEENHIDYEGVNHSQDGAFGNGHTGSLQLPFRKKESEKC